MPPKSLQILISPLDWGLGHASRCIPVVRELIQAGHEVTLAGYGRSLILLRKEFPSLESLELQGFSPSYPRSGNMVLHLFMLLPKFISIIIQEHFRLKKLIKKNHFDIIISDNRYGLWNKNTRSILITHQVMIKTPRWMKFAEYLLYRFSCLLITRFDECWIPDFSESPGLSGDLAHKYPLPANAKFIGPLSRFQHSALDSDLPTDEGGIVVILSGPEPQRSIFEDLITNQLSGLNQSTTIISGKPESEIPAVMNRNLTILAHLASDKLSAIITSSSLVICRSGYSSVMDLNALGAKALFVPTPGQTEQIYLAKLHLDSGAALWRSQENLNLKADVAKALEYPGFIKNIAQPGLNTAIAGLKKK